jgi:hypothetical protein
MRDLLSFLPQKSRLRLLFGELDDRYPEDWYLTSVFHSLEVVPENQKYFVVYSEAVELLNEDCWGILKEKLIDAFKSNHPKRGKLHFFSILNEAIACQYLKCRGFASIFFLPESKKHKVPDLSYLDGSEVKFCEVKTIDVSDEEIARGESGEAYDGSVYYALSEDFLSVKLKNIITSASRQLDAAGGRGMIFVSFRLDDFTHAHIEDYKSQLVSYFKDKFPSLEIYIKFGLLPDHSLYIFPSTMD